MTTATNDRVRKTAGKKVSRLQSMSIDSGKGPELALEGMTLEEKGLFMEVVKACVEAIHKTNPIQQAANMEAFFASSCRSSLFFAGLHVRELRKMQDTFQDEE